MKENRFSFLPELPADANLVFCHNQLIQDDILNSIQMRFATNKPIKMLIFGDWGVGKTHLMHHIRWWLGQNHADYPAYPVLIEIGDITKKSRFSEIVRPFLDALSLDFLVELVHHYRGIEPNVAQALRTSGISAHVAEAFNKILLSSPGQAPVDLVVQAFEFLKGRKVSGQASVGLTQPLDQSQDFVDVLSSVGEMYRVVHDHRILFIADEAARLENVESDDTSQSHWVNANKLVFDAGNSSFGFIYTVSGKQQRDLPRAIWDPQIQNRLGENSFRLDTLATNDVESYLNSLVQEFIDWTRVQTLVDDGTIPADSYSRDAYPFTAEARAHFLEYFGRTQENAKPRDISTKLDEVAFLAGKQGRRLIDRECLERSNM